ncbi:MAG: amidohydrolase [Oscillospiraceae bacterium]|nr:amidohydrolase [Oscillospiraceae bacterium]
MDRIEQRIIEIIDANREKLIAFAREGYKTAEGSFEEVNTAKRVENEFKALGLGVKTGMALTGVEAEIGSGKSGPTLGVIGELDGIMCPSHPFANAESGGFSHACGHHAQINALIGAAIALSDSEVAAALDGKVKLMAVPAEEFVSVKKRKTLIEKGLVKRCCGKSEMLCNGDFDGVDIALSTHVHMAETDSDLLLGNVKANGTLTKIVHIYGKAAHAAAAPHEGVNALSAATLGMTALGLVRETFKDSDSVRIHTNVTRGGDVVNVVPDHVVIDGMVRASNLAALEDAGKKFDRAFIGCAEALGAKAEIETWQGYMPVRYEPTVEALRLAVKAIDPEGKLLIEEATAAKPNAASTDLGDLSHVMPIVNFTHSGVQGALHSADFEVTDEEKALIIPAKMFALTVYHLLKDGAKQANEVIDGFEPVFTLEEYKKYVEALK